MNPTVTNPDIDQINLRDLTPGSVISKNGEHSGKYFGSMAYTPGETVTILPSEHHYLVQLSGRVCEIYQNTATGPLFLCFPNSKGVILPEPTSTSQYQLKFDVTIGKPLPEKLVDYGFPERIFVLPRDEALIATIADPIMQGKVDGIQALDSLTVAGVLRRVESIASSIHTLAGWKAQVSGGAFDYNRQNADGQIGDGLRVLLGGFPSSFGEQPARRAKESAEWAARHARSNLMSIRDRLADPALADSLDRLIEAVAAERLKANEFGDEFIIKATVRCDDRIATALKDILAVTDYYGRISDINQAPALKFVRHTDTDLAVLRELVGPIDPAITPE